MFEYNTAEIPRRPLYVNRFMVWFYYVVPPRPTENGKMIVDKIDAMPGREDFEHKLSRAIDEYLRSPFCSTADKILVARALRRKHRRSLEEDLLINLCGKEL